MSMRLTVTGQNGGVVELSAPIPRLEGYALVLTDRWRPDAEQRACGCTGYEIGAVRLSAEEFSVFLDTAEELLSTPGSGAVLDMNIGRYGNVSLLRASHATDEYLLSVTDQAGALRCACAGMGPEMGSEYLSGAELRLIAQTGRAMLAEES